MTTNGLHLDAYIRVSRVGKREGTSFISVDEQRREISAWADAHGVQITWHEAELNKSGGTMSRPIFNTIMARIREGKTQGIICAKLDRFARSFVGAINAIEEMEKHGAVLVCTRDNIDMSTPMGKAFFRILLTFAALERDRLTEGFVAAQNQAHERGAYIGPTPFGYVRVTAVDDPRKGALDVHPIEGPIVTEAFRVASVDGFDKAVDYLRSVTDRPWKVDEVRRMFAKRVYLGEVGVNGHTNTEAHEPLTTLAHWTGAQTLAKPRRANGDYPLTHVAVCGRCGAPMTGQVKHNAKGRYRRMVCSATQNGRHDCKGTSIDATALEGHVLDLLKANLNVPAFRVRMTNGMEEAQTAVSMAESRLEAFLATFDVDSGPAFKAQADKLTEALSVAQDTLAEIAAQASRSETLPTADELDSPEGFARGLRAAVDRIVVSPERGTVDQRAEVVWA